MCPPNSLTLAEARALDRLYRCASIRDVLRQVADELDHARRIASTMARGLTRAAKDAVKAEAVKVARSATEALAAARRIGEGVIATDFRPVRDRVENSAKAIARVARKATRRRMKEKIGASLSVEQAEIIEATARQVEQTMARSWPGHFGPRLEAEIARQFSAEALEVNIGRMVGDMLTGRISTPEVPGTFRGTAKQYFRTVASAVQNKASNTGAVLAMEEAGIETYLIQATIDARTSKFCRWINGTTFSVAVGASLARDYGAGLDPGFLSVEAAQSLGGTDGLAAAGLSLPPYHHNCRTIVVPA